MKNLFTILSVVILVNTCFSAVPNVTLETNFGPIEIELYDANAPVTVANFLAYVRSGFYDNTIFHRVINGFVAQAGGFDTDLNEKPTADPIVNEFDISNTKGTLAMAKIAGDPNSATSQFFINLVDNSGNLDNQNGGFTVFGKVISDFNVVEAIADVNTDSSGVPVGPNTPVIIYSATVTPPITGDIDGQFDVDHDDLVILAGQWLAGEKLTPSDHGNIGSDISDISQNIYVWQDANDDIHAYDINDSNAFAVCTAAGQQQLPRISGSVVVWEDKRNGNDDIYAYNISAQREFVVTDNSLPENQPDVSGNIIVWRDYQNYWFDFGGSVYGRTDIYAANVTDINNPVIFPVCTSAQGQITPAIDGNLVVWDDYRNLQHDIYAADISNPNEPNEFAVCTAAGKQCNPAVSGNYIIWEDYRYGNMAIFAYDLSTHTEFPVAFGQLANSDISGDVIIWQDYRNGHWDIYGYDISDDFEFSFQNPVDDYRNPIISASTAAWLNTSTEQLQTRKVCDQYLEGDINNDCTVDFTDFALMAQNWLKQNK